MKTKVCGLTRPDNIAEVLALGVDYVGFIFYDKSKRYAHSPELESYVTEQSAAFKATKKVGVFVNAEIDYLLNTVHDYCLDYVQLHGAESPGYCQELKLLWSVNTVHRAGIIKAFSITPDFDFSQTVAYAVSCDFFVFDTGGKGAHGGTGQKWDWGKLDEYTGNTPFLLSGGIGPLDAEDVRAISHPQFMGVDLNSRFEDEPGVKDVGKLGIFLRGR